MFRNNASAESYPDAGRPDFVGQVPQWPAVGPISEDAETTSAASADDRPLNSNVGAQAAVDCRRCDEHDRVERAASGLTPRTIELSGIYTEHSAEAVRELLSWPQSWKPGVPAMVIPYPECGEYAQVKLRVPRTKATQAADRVCPNWEGLELAEVLAKFNGYEDEYPVEAGKPIKYEKPLRQSTRLYMPVQIRPEIKDRTVPLWMTEGEKKALAGSQSGLPMVAVAGVTCFANAGFRWLKKGEGRDVRIAGPDLKNLIEGGREVVLCFDSDVDTNMNVLRSLAQAVRLLSEEGASVSIAYVPAGRGGKKRGLDDYLMTLPEAKRYGDEALEEIEESVRPANVVDVLDWLEERWNGWTMREQRTELGRAARLAKYLLTSSDDLKKWTSDAHRLLDMKVEDVKALFPPSQRNDKEEEREKPTPREWFLFWCTKNEVKFDYGTDGIFVKGVAKPVDVVFSDLFLDSGEARVGIGEKQLKHVLNTWFFAQKKVVIDSYQEKLSYRAEVGDGELLRFVRAVTGAESPVDVAALKHFVWQVKRKLHGMPVEHHLMNVLHGKTGGGKSEAVGRFIKPLEELVDTPSDLSFVNDERQGFRLGRAFIMFVDEMGKAERTNVEILKRAITAPRTSWRMMGTNRLMTAPNAATFIGASNRDLKELIYDRTGMRRFHQIHCLDRLDWEVINSLDYLMIWSSVDHTAQAPIVSVLDDLRALQEQLRVKDSVEEWLDESCAIGGDQFTAAIGLYANYVEFMDMQRRKGILSMTGFGERMKETLLATVGGEGVGWKKSSSMVYRVTLKPGATQDQRVHPFPDPFVGR